MEKIWPQRRHLRASQELDWISEGVLTILGIPKSANSLRRNGDIGRIDDQSTVGVVGSPIFKKRCTNDIPNPNISTLDISSTFSLAKTSISSRFEILREIVYVILCHYNFFCCWRRETFVKASFNSDSRRVYWDMMFWNWEGMTPIIL